ncbi:hypothetical protein V8C35DRAFT_103073 [Trichoderma chlorosporum]
MATPQRLNSGVAQPHMMQLKLSLVCYFFHAKGVSQRCNFSTRLDSFFFFFIFCLKPALALGELFFFSSGCRLSFFFFFTCIEEGWIYLFTLSIAFDWKYRLLPDCLPASDLFFHYR